MPAESQYTVILYQIEDDKTLRIIPPAADHQRIFKLANGGQFGGHMRESKMHGHLARQYWWPKMRTDVREWCQTCTVCASRNVGRTTKPLLMPIPVQGPFDHEGVDVIKFSKSAQGNQYAVVFMDYLTNWKWPEVFTVPNQTSLTISHLSVKLFITRHGVHAELLSDSGRAF